jgi:Protein of unknown function (DUF3375)
MLDFQTLSALLAHHPAWRLLRADHAPLIVSFLHRAFVAPNARTIAAADLAEMLEDELYELRQTQGEAAFSKKSAMEFLNVWASAEHAWLRKFYRQESDEPYFDLTPATEKAIAWLSTLNDRSFVGTESRLLTLFELLRQMSTGSELDPAKRIADLHKRRDEIDAEIAQVLTGNIPILDATGLKDRFQQFTQIARELLADFREVEQNFRLLDRRVRERIALWDGSKGALLEEIMGERSVISESDQGRSFRAFWDFLMSSQRQEELSVLLLQVLSLPAVAELKPDGRTKRVHYDWLEAGEHTQRTVAQLSQQLRRFLDDKAWLENRRIMDILRNIESKALLLRDQVAKAHASGLSNENMISIEETSALIELPFERPLYTPSLKPVFGNIKLDSEDEEIDASSLFSQKIVDKARLAGNIRQALQMQSQITLRNLVDTYPLQEGLAELVTYLQLGSEMPGIVVNDAVQELIVWTNIAQDGSVVTRNARIPQVIYSK